MEILEELIENGVKIIRYSSDGKTISHEVKQPLQTGLEELINPQPTLEEQIARIREDNLILMDALALAFEEVMMLRAEIGGKV